VAIQLPAAEPRFPPALFGSLASCTAASISSICRGGTQARVCTATRSRNEPEIG